MPRIGVDLGGTKIEGIALGNAGEELARIRMPTPRGNYSGTIAAIADIVHRLEQRLGETATVGIGIPGTESYLTGRIKNANSTCLVGMPLRDDLEASLHRQVRLANDANCFALSEATDGAAAGAEVVFGVILGTGVGGGIVIRGDVLTGKNSIAGEWGHNQLPSIRDTDNPLPKCYCGRSGCVETYLSGPAMARDHEKVTGDSLSTKNIVKMAIAGHEDCVETLDRYAERLGRALAVVVNILDPDVVVLGGGLSNIDYLYSTVLMHCRPYVFSDDVRTKLVRNKFGDSSGVRGAAWLWDS